MNTQTKTILVGVWLVVITVLGVYGAFKPNITTEITKDFGAVPTLDGVDSSYVKIGGLSQYFITTPIMATSSRVCMIKNPYNATSTIDSAGLNITGGILGANVMYLSTSTDGYATSTPALVAAYPIPSLAQASILWLPGTATSTPTLKDVLNAADPFGGSRFILSPGEYLTWRVATSSAGVFATYYQGTCSTIIRKL